MNKEKVEDFYERSNKWDAQRQAKRERMREEKASKELEELKSPQIIKVNYESNLNNTN